MEQLDQDVVNLARAIREVESGGNFQARGGSGEFGAYQWMPATWAAHSKMFLGREVPFGQATPEEQNEVAYKAIKFYKDKGYNVGEIASQWNSGSRDAYLKGKSGTNSQGVSYNVANYAKKVATKYHEIKGTPITSNPAIAAGATTAHAAGGFNPSPFSSGEVSGPAPESIPDYIGESSDRIKGEAKDLGKKAGTGLLHAAGNFGKGMVKGTGQLLDETAGKVGDAIYKKFGGKNVDEDGKTAGKKQAEKLYEAKGKSQKAGAYVGKKVLPKVAAATTGGAMATAAGVPVAAIASKVGSGLIKGVKTGGKVINAAKNLTWKGIIFDAIANSGSGTKGLLSKVRGLFN